MRKEFENVIIRLHANQDFDKVIARIVMHDGQICEEETTGCEVIDEDGDDTTTIYRVYIKE